MIQYLVRECPRCKRVVKLIREDSRIAHMEGLRPYQCWDGRTQATYLSEKIVICSHPHPNGWIRGLFCSRHMLVSAFKEVKV